LPARPRATAIAHRQRACVRRPCPSPRSCVIGEEPPACVNTAGGTWTTRAEGSSDRENEGRGGSFVASALQIQAHAERCIRSIVMGRRAAAIGSSL
jgi:hypothetical protein